MAYSILPILGFYQFGMVGSTLPDWYSNYYSQEDRLKSIAKVMQRLVAWDDLALQKINELVENVNNLGAADVTALLEQIEEISQDVSNVNNSINSINSLINSINEDLSDLENNQTDVSTKYDSLNTKVSTLEGKVTAVENGLSSSIIRVGTVEGNLTALSTKVDGIVVDLSDLEDSYDGLIQTVSNHSTTISSLTETLSTLEDRVSTNEANIDDLIYNSGGGSGGDNSALESRVDDLESKQLEIITDGGSDEESDEPFNSLVSLTRENNNKSVEISSLSSDVSEIINKPEDDGEGWMGLIALLNLVNSSSGGSGGGTSQEIQDQLDAMQSSIDDISSQAEDAMNTAMMAGEDFTMFMSDLGTSYYGDAANIILTNQELRDVIYTMAEASDATAVQTWLQGLIDKINNIDTLSQTIDSLASSVQDLTTRVEALESGTA